MEKTTAKDVAAWLAEQVISEPGYTYQGVIVYDLSHKFGDEFTYLNENGNPAIRKDVLAEFRKLTKDTVVWDGGERAWRKREHGDARSRQQG